MLSTQSETLLQTQILKILARTWSRDSHGLYDYEANNTRNNLLLINTKTRLVRKKNDVRQVAENAELEISDRELGRIKIDNGKYYLSNPISFNMLPTEENINEMQNKIWYVVKQEESGIGNNNLNSNSNSNDLYEIKINDIIKLGRVKYAITEMKINGKLFSIDKDVERPVFNLIHDYK